MRILSSGVDPERFFPQPQKKARATLGWDPATPVVLFNAAGSWWVKRPALAHAAVRYARQWVPHLRIEVMDGSTPPEQVPLLMNAADGLLLTSASEGSPTVVQEALACGLPVVSVRVGDTPELLADGKTGILARDNAESLAAALCQVLAEPYRQQRSSGGRQVDIGTIAAPRIADELRKIYCAIEGRRQARPFESKP